MTPLTIVSGYWKIKNKHGNNFDNWFDNSLKINCPYVFFGDAESIAMIKPHRVNLKTHYIECSISDFYTYKYYNTIKTDPRHCPSVELNLIWNEKLFLMQKAMELNPFQSEYFAWVDAGICTYRYTRPPIKEFPDLVKLNILPKNKFIFTSSASHIFNPKSVSPNNYYHYISGTFILHRDFINEYIKIFKNYLDKYLTTPSNIYTDQVINTYIYKDHQEMFYKIGDGYGVIMELLY